MGDNLISIIIFLQSNWSKKNSGVSVLDMLSLNNIFFANNCLAAGSFELYFKEFFADWFANNNSGASKLYNLRKSRLWPIEGWMGLGSIRGGYLWPRAVICLPFTFISGFVCLQFYIYFRIYIFPLLFLIHCIHQLPTSLMVIIGKWTTLSSAEIVAIEVALLPNTVDLNCFSYLCWANTGGNCTTCIT